MGRFVKDLAPREQLEEIDRILDACDGWIRVLFHNSIRDGVEIACRVRKRKYRICWVDEATETLLRLQVEAL